MHLKVCQSFLFRTKWKRQTSLGMEMMTEPTPSVTSSEGGPPADTLQNHALLQLYYQRLRSLPLLPLMFPAQHQYSAYLAALASRAARSTSPVNLSTSPINLSTSPVNLSLGDPNLSPRSGSSNRSPASHRSRSTESPPRKVFCSGESPPAEQAGRSLHGEDEDLIVEDEEERGTGSPASSLTSPQTCQLQY